MATKTAPAPTPAKAAATPIPVPVTPPQAKAALVTPPVPPQVKPDDPVLIDADGAARMCDISRSAWYKLVSTGKTPASVKLGRSVRWNRNELVRWIRAGCPARARWEIIKAMPKK